MSLSAEEARELWQSKSTGGGNFIKDGNYVHAVDQLLVTKGYRGKFLIAELLVIDAEQTNPDVKPNAVGEKVSVAFQLDGSGDKGSAQRGNAKNLMCGLLGYDARSEDRELGEQFIAAAIKYAGIAGSPASIAARGHLLITRTHRRKTEKGQNAGQENVYPRFFNVPKEQGNAEESIAKRAKIMTENSPPKAAELIGQL